MIVTKENIAPPSFTPYRISFEVTTAEEHENLKEWAERALTFPVAIDGRLHPLLALAQVIKQP